VKTIKELNNKLDELKSESNKIEAELQRSWNLVFEDLHAIRAGILALDTSNKYVFSGHGDIIAIADFDTDAFKDCQEYFTQYMSDIHFVEVDFSNGVISTMVGPSFVINDDGDVYDQENDRLFVSMDEYVGDDGVADIDKRDNMIESYMESEGFYPGVFETDRSGNVKLVNTKK